MIQPAALKWAVIWSAACLFAVHAQGVEATRTAEAGKLAVKRVVLYKNGVGYFEHVGTVKDDGRVAVALSSGQLDDVLKSLTVLDLDGGRVTSVTYDAAQSKERQLAELRLGSGDKATLVEFLGSLRGARIEVKSGTTVLTGRLLSVERKTRTGGGATVEIDYVSVMTDTGEMKTAALESGFGVRLLDRTLAASVGKYLDLVASERTPDERRMTIATSGKGERHLFVSYISEAPVWKATYRIVLSAKKGAKPLLQGWAIVDNTGAEDWDNVELSLVAGAPQSFVQALSVPYYARRPVVGVRSSLSAAPQTFDAPTVNADDAQLSGVVRDPNGAVVPNAHVRILNNSGVVVAATYTDAGGRYAFASTPEGTLRMEVNAPGFSTGNIPFNAYAGQKARQDAVLQVGSTVQSIEVTSMAPGIAVTSMAPGAMSSSASAGNRLGSGRALGSGGGIGSGRGSGVGPGSGGGFGGGVYRPDYDQLRAQMNAANANDLGDLFEYKLKEPTTIRKGQSALVPILQADVNAEKVSVWNEAAHMPKPLRALWLENTSGATLDAGSFSVLEGDAFAGEGLIESLRPGEKRLISYAVDLALTPNSQVLNTQSRLVHVRLTKGVLTVTNERVEQKQYQFRNADSTPRIVVVEHPVRAGYLLRSAVKPVETTAQSMRFRIEVPAKSASTLEVHEATPAAVTYQVANLNEDAILGLVKIGAVNKPMEESLRKVLAQQAAVHAIETQKEACEEETKKIYDDQQRLRENIKALKGSAEERALLQRYTRQLDEEETRLAALDKKTQELTTKEEAAEAELSAMIDALDFTIDL